jgi:hypothetical protein
LPSQTARIDRCTFALARTSKPIPFSSAALLPQRIEAIVGHPAWSTSSATVSTTGWVSHISGLTRSGRLRDRWRFARSGDRWTVPLLALIQPNARSSLRRTATLTAPTALWIATLLHSA